MPKKHFIKEIIIKTCIAIAILVFVTICIASVQNNISRNHQYSTSLDILNDISNTLDSNESKVNTLTEVFHASNREILDDLISLMEVESAKSVFLEASEDDNAMLDGLIGENFASYLFLIDENGNVLLSADDIYSRQNLRSIQFFSDEEFDELLKCPDEGITCIPLQGNNDYVFYAALKEFNSQSCYLIIGNDNDAFQQRINALESLDGIVQSVSLGEGEFIFTIDKQNDTISYCSNADIDILGKTSGETGISSKLLKDGGLDTVQINGTNYLCTSVSHSDDMILIEAVATSIRYNYNTKPTTWAVILLVMTLIIAIHYEYFLLVKYSQNKGKQKSFSIFGKIRIINLSAVTKVIPILILGLVLISGVVFYARTIIKLSWAMNDIQRPMNQLTIELTENEKEKESIQEYCDQMYLSKAQMIATMIEIDPSCLNEETSKVYTEYTESGEKVILTDSEGNPMTSVAKSTNLAQLSYDNDFEFIQIYNDMGYTIASSNGSWYFHLSHDSDDQSSEFYDVLDGKEDYLVQKLQIDDEGAENQYIGVSFHYYTTSDDYGSTVYVSRLDYQKYLDGNWDGNPITEHQSLLQCAVDTTLIDDMMESLDISYIMDHVSLTNDAYMVVFDNSSDHKILYTPNEENMGKTASELNVSDSEFSGTFNGFQTVQGVKYFECCRYNDGYYIAIATPLNSLYSTRRHVTEMITFACFLAMILILGLFSITSEDNILALRSNESTVQEKASDNSRKQFRYFKNLSKWIRKFSHKSPEEKITFMIRVFALLIGIYLIIGLIFAEEIFSESSMIRYVFSDDWERGINIFAFTESVVLVVTVLVTIEILEWFISMAFSVFNSNAITISHLLMSFVRYGSVIVVFFYCFYLFGTQPISILASAGVITLVIGLGAQSLIGDMLASIFIIFEHSYLVGDLVKINGTIGYVKEIGIRTTKILDLNNYTVICNNSEIKDIVNLSAKNTHIRMILSIPYEESVKRVEKVLSDELPLFKQRIPQITEGPIYGGVAELSASSVDLRITVMCNGKDYLKVYTGMNRELLLMCDKYDINIPYQHITIEND